ncbi:MAG: alpha-glucuronidase family glycosyl hydrolase [Candidatus Cyclobacteriaceae bacterium M2_1C_046]
MITLIRHKKSQVRFITALFLAFLTIPSFGNNGYDLWLQYQPIKDKAIRDSYITNFNQIVVSGGSATTEIIKDELERGLTGLLNTAVLVTDDLTASGALIAGTPGNSSIIKNLGINPQLKTIGDEGFILKSTSIDGKKAIVIAANTEVGVLYGTFRLLNLLQQHRSLENLDIISAPKIKHRVLNHWDNLDRTVERGYAGFSIWDWHKLPDYIDQRYIDYARANASLGINGTVLTNVNANALVLTEDYIDKVAALANTFRPYGLKIYLTARFSAPVEIGGLDTADPLAPEVIAWWKDKANEIYKVIPDFGGFLVKANSEGQPGPQNYGRSHAEGANLLADALKPHGGIVMWRAFVYSNEEPEDRAKQAYNEFKPLDGKFRDNVLIQVKNGAIDFQPREPFHPLFGAMPDTPLMMEFQITKEYLGFSTHLAYLAPLFKEVLDADTHAKGKGSTVAKVIDGSLHNYERTGIAGVANIGNDINWTGSIFGQADWYAFGRLAWDHEFSSEEIAEEWLKMTFSNENKFVEAAKEMMMNSREAVVNYMTPLGLHHLMGWSHHYGPGPWIKDKHRADWTSVYYHRADEEGVGFDRTASGSNAVSQYFPPVAKKFGDIDNCPEKYLLWFHHVPWDHEMNSGRILWDELNIKYQSGVDTVRKMQETWETLQGYVDPERFNLTKTYLKIQEKEAEWWKNACLTYFQTFSDKPFPEEIEAPKKPLEYYINLDPKYVPGN